MSLSSLKNKNVLKELEKTISPVLVVNNSSLKPYVELFDYAPENIYQQPLGSLVGFFEIKEYSDESAYIVNFLTSVLKKEYYINPKRPVTESLDSALHKVNIALSELVKQGNVEWLGKLNAAICVLEKNNAHFSVTGNAKLFLYRKELLTEISEDLASDSLDPHPLKTFINVSSGRLEKTDRLLITSEDIFHILSIAEIKKNFQRLEGEKFVQFLKTALSNQIEMIASVVVEMTEPEPEVVKKPAAHKKAASMANVFSEKTFANSLSTATASPQDEFNTPEETTTETSDYTDKKTGHIYIQGEADDIVKVANPQINLYQELLKEKISQGIYLAKNELRKKFSLYKKQLAKKKAAYLAERERKAQIAAEQAKQAEEQRVLAQIEQEQQLAQEKELERVRLEQEFAAQEKAAQESASPRPVFFESASQEEPEDDQDEDLGLSFKEKLRRAKLEYKHNAVIDLRKKVEIPATPEEFEEELDFEQEEQFLDEEEDSNSATSKTKLQSFITKISPALQTAKKIVEANIAKLKQNSSGGISSTTISIVPHFSKIKALFSSFTAKQKLYTFGALLLVFIVPLFIVKALNKPKSPTITELRTVELSQVQKLASEKNIYLNTETRNITSSQNIVTSLFTSNGVILITKNNITLVQNNNSEEFQLPAESGVPTRAAYMNDLSLVLVLTDNNKIISFSPISKKFSENKIDLGSAQASSFVGTYLTYLYVLDQKSNQIYRYPRAEGGFGEKTNWLKDQATLSQVTDMTIDDNIYAVQDNKVLKFFKGKAEPFTLEASATPVHFDKIYTTPELQSLYALDTQNSRIVQYSKDGSITAQFYNEQIKNGTSFAVDEPNKTAYLATSSGLISVLLQ